MQIQQDKVVHINYQISDANARQLESSDGKSSMAYLHGYNNLPPALDANSKARTKVISVPSP